MKTPSSFGFCDVCFADTQHLRQRGDAGGSGASWICPTCGGYEPDDQTISFCDPRTSYEARRVFAGMLKHLSAETLYRMRDECTGQAENIVLDELWRRHNARTA